MKWWKISILATIVATLFIVAFLGEKRFFFTSRSSTAIGHPFLRHPIIDSRRTSTIFPTIYGSVDLEVEDAHRVLQEAGLTATVPIPSYAEILIVVGLTCLSALLGGLTLGLLSLDKTQLEILMNNAADPKAAEYAKRIYPVRANGNSLLCTLMWATVASNVIQSILLSSLLSPLAGFLVSTLLLVVCTEILPLAICSRHALVIGSCAAPFVRILVYIFFPISYPLAWILDKLLGHELGTIYTKEDFHQLLEIHAERGEGYNREMTMVMTGALKYQDLKVIDIMTTVEEVYMLSGDVKLSYENILAIFKAGYSRIPVYEGKNKNDIIGLLLTKDLIFIDPADNISVEVFVRIFGRGLHVVSPNDSLGDILRELKKGKSHMALVREICDKFYEIKGIVTLEDIIEVILGDEIYDETDADLTNGIESNQIAFDFEKLRSLDMNQGKKTLQLSERKAVVAYFRAHYNHVVSQLSDRMLEMMIATTAVMEFDDDAADSNEVSEKNKIYQEGIPSDTCTLILSGTVTVLVGKEKFRSEMGPWSVLAATALTDNEYTPDYSAFISSRGRCLRINRETFLAAQAASVEEQKWQAHAPSQPKDSIERRSTGINDRAQIRSELLAVYNNSVAGMRNDTSK